MRNPRAEVAAMATNQYCFCRRGDDGRFMIYCDLCRIWFHGSCVAMTKKIADNLPHWYCFYCSRNKKVEQDILKNMEEFQEDAAKKFQSMSEELQVMKRHMDLEQRQSTDDQIKELTNKLEESGKKLMASQRELQENKVKCENLQGTVKLMQKEKAQLLGTLEEKELNLKLQENELQRLQMVQAENAQLQEKKPGPYQQMFEELQSTTKMIEEEKAQLLVTLEEKELNLKFLQEELQRLQNIVNMMQGEKAQLLSVLEEKEQAYKLLQEKKPGPYQQIMFEELQSRIKNLQEEKAQLLSTLEEKERKLRNKSRLSLRR